MIGEFFRHRIGRPLLALLRQGVTPEKISLGLALGIVAAHNPITLDGIRRLIQANPGKAIATLWISTLHALAVWAILGVLAVFPIYRILLTPLRRLARLRAVSR